MPTPDSGTGLRARPEPFVAQRAQPGAARFGSRSADALAAAEAPYNRWADTRLDACVPGLDEEAYRRDRGAFFGSVRRTVNQLLLVDRLWSARIGHRETGIGSLNPILFEGFEGLKDARVG